MLAVLFLLTFGTAQEYTEENPCVVTDEEIQMLYKCKEAAHIRSDEDVIFYYSDGFPRFNDYWKNKETISGPLFRFFYFDMANLTFPELRKADTKVEVIFGKLQSLSFPKLESIATHLYIYNNPTLADVTLKKGVSIASVFIENNNKLRKVVLEKIDDSIVSDDVYLQDDGNCIFAFTVTSLKELDGCKLIESVIFDPYVTDLDFWLPKMTITRELQAVNTNLITLSFFEAGPEVNKEQSGMADLEVKRTWFKVLTGNPNLCDKDLNRFSDTVKKNCLPQVYTQQNPCFVSQAGIDSFVTCKEAAHIEVIKSIVVRTTNETAFNEYWKNKETITGKNLVFSVNITELNFPQLRYSDVKISITKSNAQKLSFPKLEWSKSTVVGENPNLTEINFKKGINGSSLTIFNNNKLTKTALQKARDATVCGNLVVQSAGDCSFPFVVVSLKEFKECKNVAKVTFSESVKDLDFLPPSIELTSSVSAINTNLKTLSFFKTAENFEGFVSELTNNANLCDKNLERFVMDKDYLKNNCQATSNFHGLFATNSSDTTAVPSVSEEETTTAVSLILAIVAEVDGGVVEVVGGGDTEQLFLSLLEFETNFVRSGSQIYVLLMEMKVSVRKDQMTGRAEEGAVYLNMAGVANDGDWKDYVDVQHNCSKPTTKNVRKYIDNPCGGENCVDELEFYL